MPKRIDLAGKKFGKLTVLKFYGVDKYNKALWECYCECGNIVIVASTSLRKKYTFSCGCYHKERVTKHGMSRSRIYHVYYDILQRCNNEKHANYSNYGGRGITVCNEWHDFYSFYSWAVNNGYEKGLSIERINNNESYNPNNCRWATTKEQSLNKRNSKLITYRNKTQTLKQWCDELGLKYLCMQQRIKISGWTVDKAFNTPIKSKL